MDWSHIPILISDASIVFALWSCLRIKRPRQQFFSILLLVLVIDFLTELVGYFAIREGLRNAPMYNVFAVVEFLLILRLLAVLRPGSKWPFIITAFLGLAGWTWSWSRWRSFDFLLTEGISMASLLITLWVVVLLWRLSEESRTPLGKVPEFWVLTALLVFYGALFPIIGPLRLLYEDSPQLASYLYSIVQVLSVVRYGLIGYGCILEARARRTPLKE
ncbi:MAG: hypothetical protein IPO60_02935 [Flavobacteriales bacterium]|jgi:hypothetical protein|nr:hypothetical protein [Flavobacteriales bacterium]MBK6892127.1 hypothetical protein [Flavobacteriales bacterium]MBK7246262.1 hypothetical protein [Flavobacteriales bacterium]MBK7286160.1 hypothetical protein [Flavobacteriales bacterium]MBK9059970.1 hypothetical protein [Flavobacteriales bacterium]